MELGRLIRQELHLKATIPDWRERRILFGPEEKPIEEKAIPEEEKGSPLVKPSSILFKHLERNFKRLRRKVRKGLKPGSLDDPRRLQRLEEISKKIEELESEL